MSVSLLSWPWLLRFFFLLTPPSFLRRRSFLAAHDFLRLVGYGNGIGCLTDKGLPGFIGLRQQALDIDELLAQSYQGDKAKSGGKNADDTSVEPQNASGDLMGGVDDSGLELAENAEKPKEGADQEQDAERNQKAQKEPDQTPPSAAKEDGDSPHEE